SASAVQVNAGDLVVVVCRQATNGGSLPTVTVTDTAGDSFAAATSSVAYNSQNSIQLFYAKNAIGQSSAGSVTCNYSGNTTWYDAIAVLEYSGASTSSPLDASQVAGGVMSGGAITTSNFTTAFANEIGVCGYSGDALGVSFTPGSSFAAELVDASNFAGASDRTMTTTVTTNGTVAISGGGGSGEIVCATFH
ncbi:MAG: hypothetical protein WB611_13905, partial [Stellaceae bacterium]